MGKKKRLKEKPVAEILLQKKSLSVNLNDTEICEKERDEKKVLSLPSYKKLSHRRRSTDGLRVRI